MLVTASVSACGFGFHYYHCGLLPTAIIEYFTISLSVEVSTEVYSSAPSTTSDSTMSCHAYESHFVWD